MLFKDEYDFLSNFYPAVITVDNITYPTLENAYQAQKCIDCSKRIEFVNITPGQAKRLGRKVELRKDWEEVKDSIMYDLLLKKFSNAQLRERLRSVKEEIVESNYWHDNYWGSCVCNKCQNKGSNKLGKMLMKIRDEENK